MAESFASVSEVNLKLLIEEKDLRNIRKIDRSC